MSVLSFSMQRLEQTVTRVPTGTKIRVMDITQTSTFNVGTNATKTRVHSS